MSYYISPRFLDKLAVHITKNFLELPGVRVPLILGIHGRKGEGKSFQCELVFEKMGIEAVHISGGELESPDAGDPARLLRLRYREAAELIKVRGKMTAIVINDLDAGAGRFDQGTQYTVNTQLVNATLMNIADNPTNVQLPGSYDSTPLHRVPIIVTGNDLSTLYAPLVRDGRMDKFFWEPNREDKIGIVSGIFSQDGLSPSEIEQFVDTFIDQAIDFFGAVRARIYDELIREFIHKVGIDRVSARVVNSADGKPNFIKPDFRLPRLIEFGNLMVQEQQRVKNSRLVEEYNAGRLNFNQPTANVAPTTPIQNEVPNNSTKVETVYKVNYATSNGQVNGAKLSAETQEQVRQLLAQGYRIATEHADERRFRTQSWQSCSPIQTTEVSDAIASLESCLNDHTGEYVRLIGIDPKVKRRVVEKVIQKPH
ncbi:ribulose bisphosphate carboxylase small subunit [Planktothrix sp. FACHB-1355]|uniref:Ribulose bisphosphate carboxylase small subunit n=1 Tax=Aerosakkonema funiforme FACHB-1375 TaxID=2949571 RepID=A0A926ZKY9_9CYAN|nr:MULTISPECIES: ribulose bisphosphate carboxylase small subunit [Oscillatoriales]MBD2184521.1 ribulose bisphosphate carboxylase small subunit [Aerosakkonema funiforme FACHB-1375]MBD3559634.1 ribulose bisphosphate carboxylase small subunit [Planktothrix sp. FACHB-1355]